MNRLVVIAASAGGHKPLWQITEALPAHGSAAVLVVMHIGPHPSLLPGLLRSHGKLPAKFGEDDDLIEPGVIYIAPPDQHMLVETGRIRLSNGPKVHHTRPAADPLFISAAKIYGPWVLGVVLSGGGEDGTDGLRVIRKHSGVAFVQDPREAEARSMPLHAIAADHPNAGLPVKEIAQRIKAFCWA